MPEPRCCFCQKAQHKVTNLIAGPENLRICDECVALMCGIIAEQNDKWRKRQIKRLMKRDLCPNKSASFISNVAFWHL